MLRFILDQNLKNDNESFYSFRIMNKYLTVIRDPDFAKKVLISNKVRRSQPYFQLVEYFGPGIFTDCDHLKWVHQKKIVMNLLHTNQLVNLSHGVYEIISNEANSY